MKSEFEPQHLNIAVFSRNKGSLSGSEKLSDFPRLKGDGQGVAQAAAVRYAARGEMLPDAAGVDEPWLHLSAQTRLSLVCQRCLGAVEVPVGFERSFRFVASEALAEIEDEESEEDVLVVSKAFNLLELLEDELLMAAPLVPMHEECPEAVKWQAADPDFEDAADEKPNPFAVLQQLKKAGGESKG